MMSALFSFSALFLAVFCLLMGIGLLNTLLSLKMALAGFGTQTIGLIMSAYFAGQVAGAFFCRGLIEQVGHIRSFAAFAALATAAVLMHGVLLSAPLWLLLRLITGLATFGLYMVIESWFYECTGPEARGRVFSIYMVLTYLGMSIGQQLLALGDTAQQQLFLVAGILLVMSLVPVVATSGIHPDLPKTGRFSVAKAFKTAPLGIMGCLTAGLINGAFYSLAPVFGARIGMSPTQVSWMMSVTILGGLACQWPMGLVSDRCDRTIVLPVVGICVALTGVALLLSAALSMTALMLLMGLLGGFIFGIYPVSVARAHDLFAPGQIVAVSSVLLFGYGIGAVIGPNVASAVMALTGSPYGFFLYCTMMGAGFSLVALYFRKKEKLQLVPVDDQVEFVAMKNVSTQVSAVIDPRSPVPADEPD